MERAIVFDRDGVVNEAVMRNGIPTPPRTLSEFAFVSGFEQLYDYALRKGYRLFIATNQPDIHRGLTTREFVSDIHKHIRTLFPKIEEVVMCDHDNVHQCFCRKPNPGMLFYLKGKYDLEISESFFIGDRNSDVQCGQLAGCKTILLDHGYPKAKNNVQPTYRVLKLSEVTKLI